MVESHAGGSQQAARQTAAPFGSSTQGAGTPSTNTPDVTGHAGLLSALHITVRLPLQPLTDEQARQQQEQQSQEQQGASSAAAAAAAPRTAPARAYQQQEADWREERRRQALEARQRELDQQTAVLKEQQAALKEQQAARRAQVRRSACVQMVCLRSPSMCGLGHVRAPQRGQACLSMLAGAAADMPAAFECTRSLRAVSTLCLTGS